MPRVKVGSIEQLDESHVNMLKVNFFAFPRTSLIRCFFFPEQNMQEAAAAVIKTYEYLSFVMLMDVHI